MGDQVNSVASVSILDLRQAPDTVRNQPRGIYLLDYSSMVSNIALCPCNDPSWRISIAIALLVVSPGLDIQRISL